MITEEIKKKIQLIQIKTKRKLNALVTGNSNSIIKGSGYDFDQIREYVSGDDIRFIDFKSSAKIGKLCVRQYKEEKNRTIIIFIDVSASNFFSSNKSLKHDVICEIGSIIALAANHCKDNFGLVLFTNKIVKFIPPSKGSLHVNFIMEQLFNYNDEYGETDINFTLQDWMKNYKKKCIIFLISDFININCYAKTIGILSSYSDFFAIRYNDKIENNLLKFGLLNLVDIETNETYCLDLTSSKKTELINNEIDAFFSMQEKKFKKNKIPFLNLKSDEDHVMAIIKFFNKRLMY